MSKRSRQFYSLRSFVSYVGQHKLRFGITMLSFAVADLLLAVIPLFIGKLVGALAAHPLQGHQAVIDVWILVALSSGHNLLWRLSEYIYTRLISPLSFRYESMLFRMIIRKPYPYFVDKFTGKLSSYISTISQEQRSFFDDLCYNYTNEVISLVTVLIILVSVNWQTGVIFAVGIIAMAIVGRYSIRPSAKYEKHFADIQSTKNARIIDAIANFVNVKSFRTEAVEIKYIDSEQQTVIRAARRSQLWTQFFWASMSTFVRDGIWPATIGFNVYLFLHGELSIGQLTTVLSTVLLFTTTVWEIIWYVSQFNLKLARIDEAHRYLFGDVNIVKLQASEHERQPDVRSMASNMKLNKLSFAYPDKADRTVLSALDFQLTKGEKLGIVGRSGSGKTTLTKLLLGYYPVGEGQIALDDRPIDTRDLAAIISYVPQDTSMFHRTIAENIAYAAERKVSRAEIRQAAIQAHAHEFIEQLSDEYYSMVGERGVKLSAGQRQRIAIARAILDDKPILILDEATSALDSESEVLVQEALEALWTDKTVIAIAHRLSTLRHMDRIIVLDKGRVVEQGSHQQLLAKKGLYAEFWNHQSGGFIEE